MTQIPQSKQDAQAWSCGIFRDFLSHWDRVNSIINLMEDAVLEEVKEAGDGQMETWLPEVVAVNTAWLRDRLEEQAEKARKSLEEAGFACGRRI